MEELFDALRSLTKVFEDTKSFETDLSVFKACKTELEPLNDIIGDLPIEIDSESGMAQINGVKLNEVETEFRCGKINEFYKKVKMADTVDSSVESQIQSEIRRNTNIPDIDNSDLNLKIEETRKVYSELDVDVGSSVDDFKSKLSASSKGKLEGMWDSAIKKFGRGAKIIGVVTVVVLGDDMYQSLYDATKKRNGCKLLQKVDGKTSSTDVANRFCDDTNDNINKKNNSNNNINLFYNINIYVTYAVYKDDSLLKDINDFTNLNITKDNYSQIISDSKNWSTLTSFYKTKSPQIDATALCALYGKGKYCVSCNSTDASVSDVNYLDASTLPSNYSITCVTDSTLLGALLDGMDPILSPFFFSFKKYLIYGGVIILCIILFNIIFKLVNK